MKPAVFRLAQLFLMLVAFVLLILASLSVPIVKSISYIVATSNSDSFTRWSLCPSDRLNPADRVSQVGLYGACLNDDCSSTTIGYALDSLPSVPGGSTTTNVLTGSLSCGLILHPITAAITLIAALLALAGKPTLQGGGFFLGLLACFLTMLCLIMDLWLFIQVRAAINASTKLTARLGRANWLVVIALVLLSLASLAGLKLRKMAK